MAGISVTPSYRYLAQTYQGVPIRQAQLVIAGLGCGYCQRGAARVALDAY